MDFNEFLELLPAYYVTTLRDRRRSPGGIVIELGGNEAWCLRQLQTEVEKTRLWLFETGTWSDSSRTMTVSAPKGDEVTQRVLYPLGEHSNVQMARRRAKYCLDSSARIWTRGRKGALYPRESDEFAGESNVILQVIELLRAARRDTATS